MIPRFEGTGRLGAAPEMKTIGSGDDAKQLVTFTCYFEGRVKTGDGYADKYGYWREVEIWKDGLGKRVHELLEKGMMVRVEGVQLCDKYEKDGEQRERHKIRAEDVFVDLIGIQEIVRKPKAQDQAQNTAEAA